jgi:hypothetical protein
VLRGSFLRNGCYLDQVLYAILDVDWRAAAVRHVDRARASAHVH